VSIRIMSSVWTLELHDSQKLVLLALADSANDEGHCWPSMVSLSRKCSKSDRTIQRVIKELEALGHLTRKEVVGKGCNYHIHPRHDVTPETMSPRNDDAKPPTPFRGTPETVSDKPSYNHQEPSIDKPPEDERLTIQDIFEGWNDFAAKHDLPRAEVFSERRKKQAKARLKQHPDLDTWKRALRHISETPFLRGENERGWRANFDFFLQEKSFTKLIEGSYGKAD